MKEQKSIIIMVIMLVIIIVGAIICKEKGFNIELTYMERQEFVVNGTTDLDKSKIEEIAESVLEYKRVRVLTVDEFGNSVQIISTDISEEEKDEIITKINEEYSLELESDDISIVNVPSTRIRDILKPYILPGIITFAAVLLYFLILYHKLGLIEVLLKGILLPIMVELTYYSIIAITRIPFGRMTNAIAIGIYVLTIGALTMNFQYKKSKLPETSKKENDE